MLPQAFKEIYFSPDLLCPSSNDFQITRLSWQKRTEWRKSNLHNIQADRETKHETAQEMLGRIKDE